MTGIPDLTSISEHNRVHDTNLTEMSFTEPTRAYREITALHAVLDRFSPVGRTHLLRLDKGGFFPPHRDSLHRTSQPKSFRVLVPLAERQTDWVFLYDERRVLLENGRAYYINTFKNHSLFSFVNGVMMLVVNVPFTHRGVGLLIDAFHSR